MNNMSMNLGQDGNVAYLNSPKKWINFQSKDGSQASTMLQLISFGDSCVENVNLKGEKRKWLDIDGGMVSGYYPLVAGFSCSSSTLKSINKGSSGDASIVSSASIFDKDHYINLDLNLQYEPDKKNVHIPKSSTITPLNNLVSKSALNLMLSPSIGPTVSAITTEVGTSTQHLINHKTSTVHDGSVSSPRGHGSSLVTYMRDVSTSSVDSPSWNSKKKNRSNWTKKCQFFQCQKLARGASGHCIAHGGGKRCQKADCGRTAEGKSIFCKFHGGGRRCERLGCLKSAIGSTNFCIAHGGGHRCNYVDCTKISRGKSGLCIKHGGGRRCKIENCAKSAISRYDLCIAHGGGRRCHHEGCSKSAQGSTMFCKAHGGGKRCSVKDCSKAVEGRRTFCKRHDGGKCCLFQGGDMCSKSAHGGTQLCVAHGFAKRCAAPKCTRSIHDGIDCCSRHGGGKRCQHDGCDKSAQGRTNFCKTHGGIKRFSWGSQARPDIGFNGPSCNYFSISKFGLCAAHSVLEQEHHVHGGKNIRTPTAQKPVSPEKMMVSAIEEICLFGLEASSQNSLIEGRVHGGSLMALLAKGVPLNQPESQVDEHSTSNQF